MSDPPELDLTLRSDEVVTRARAVRAHFTMTMAGCLLNTWSRHSGVTIPLLVCVSNSLDITAAVARTLFLRQIVDMVRQIGPDRIPDELMRLFLR